MLWKSPQRIILNGQYCRLEPLRATTHCTDLWAVLVGHDSVWRYLPYGPWQNERLFYHWLQEWENSSERAYYAVIDKKSGNALGALSLYDWNTNNGTVELGGIFFSSKLQRTRMASEAVYLLGRYIFDCLGYRRLQWKCSNGNLASKNAARRFGFAYEGMLRQDKIVKGESRDTVYFSILDKEWSVCRAGFEKWLDSSNFDEHGQQITQLHITENKCLV